MLPSLTHNAHHTNTHGPFTTPHTAVATRYTYPVPLQKEGVGLGCGGMATEGGGEGGGGGVGFDPEPHNLALGTYRVAFTEASLWKKRAPHLELTRRLWRLRTIVQKQASSYNIDLHAVLAY